MTSQRTEFQNYFYKWSISSIHLLYPPPTAPRGLLEPICAAYRGWRQGYTLDTSYRKAPGPGIEPVTLLWGDGTNHRTNTLYGSKETSYFRHVAVRLVIYHFARSFLSLVTDQQQSEENYHLIPIQFSPAGRFSAKPGRQCNAAADWLLSTQINTANGKTSSLTHITACDGGTNPKDLRRIHIREFKKEKENTANSYQTVMLGHTTHPRRRDITRLLALWD